MYIKEPNEPATLSRIQALCGINPKIWKDLTDKGVFADCETYQEYFTTLFNHYRQSKEAKDAAAQAKLAEAESKPRFRDEDIRKQLDQVTIAEKLQKIHLDRTKEEELLIKIRASRGEYTDKSLMEQLMFPTFHAIANILRHEADLHPELQPVVDRCFNELYTLSERLEEQAVGDSKRYVEAMLNKQVQLEEMINQFQDTLND